MRKWIVIGLLSASLGLAAQGKGQGAIVVRDGAPVFKEDTGNETRMTLNRGDAVAGYVMSNALFGGGNAWRFNDKNGRTRVWFLVKGKAAAQSGWMLVEDLAKFTYDGSCAKGAAPSDTVGFKIVWNPCFEEARDAKLEALREKWAHESPSAIAPASVSLPVPAPTAKAASASAATPATAPASEAAPVSSPAPAAPSGNP